MELEKLREDMERMEEERELMVAEVEAQIERALASMLVDDEDNVIYRSQSRPTSRSSRIASPIGARSRSAPGSRRHSFSAVDGLPAVRDSFATVDTILAEHAQREKRSMAEEAIEEELSDHRPKEEKPRTELSKKKSKHFDDIDPLDAGISEKSDRIAQKVLQIQQKVCPLRRR
jgi:nicotinamide N-methyltransferase